MSVADLKLARAGAGPTFSPDAHWASPVNAFECTAILTPEDGGFCVYIAELPGVISEGDTVDDALRNIAEALEGSLQDYLERGVSIPWLQNAEPLIPGQIQRRVFVHA